MTTNPEPGVERRGSVLWLTIRRQERRNALGPEVLAGLTAALAQAQGDRELPDVKVGLFPAQVLAVLQRLLPRRQLMELCLPGESLEAEQALAIGLVNHGDADLDGRLDRLLARITDKSLRAIEAMTFEESMAFTESQIALSAQTEAAKGGQAAFREKRAPQWKGR